ncbi:phage antirepressor N-terminal domain-containing protein [Sporohalobacter salinus]|uniref:phage antirepressor N-terminal domain-containing protein n=1 Tax=Sporohalobacter salinus TaxID=1494606 RepID=UPI00195F4307|nr:phage antirepressor N-terminal domain-containing protein [Sporohalobacter salinus]MBM7624754.1 flagellar hook-basal body complex protein FliE [Sporohalobacter salinus]
MSNLAVVKQKAVDFQGSELLGIKANDGNIYVGMRWVMRGIGFTKGKATREIQKAKKDEVVSKGVSNLKTLTSGGKQTVKCLNIDFLPLWLAKISITPTIKKEQPKVAWNMTQYQLKAKDVLAEAFIENKKPNNEFDLMRQMIDKLEETNQRVIRAEQKVDQTQDELKTTKHRVDNLDAVNLQGNLRQRLNKMVRKYAFQNGNDFKRAWNDFKKSFNTAFNTNIELLKTNHQQKTGREVSTPEILEIKGMLADAIRIADKMINQSA